MQTKQYWTIMDKEHLLEKTDSAISSVDVMVKLRERVLLTTDFNDTPKKGRLEFDNKAIQFIYDTLYDNSYPGTFWEEFIYIVCSDMEKFKFSEISSVGFNSELSAYSSDVKMSSAKIDLYKNTSLLEHTFNVTLMFLYEKNIPRETRFLLLCSCVLHDMGKSLELTKHVAPFQLEKTYSHEKRGHSYIMHLKEQIIANNKSDYEASSKFRFHVELINNIADAVLYHHSYNSKYGTQEFFVMMVDRKTREAEWERYKNGDKSLMLQHINKELSIGNN